MSKNSEAASVLSFEKKMVCSDGYLYQTCWEDRKEENPIQLIEKSVRGTISNRLKEAVAKDPAKLNAEVEKANLQTVDSAALDMGKDTLKMKFTLKVISGAEKPSACNHETQYKTIQKMGREYIERYQFKELATRYAMNIANGRFLWRNRVGCEKIEVIVKTEGKMWNFNAYEFSLRDFDQGREKVKELAELIAKTLRGDQDYLLLDIEAYALIGEGQEVYPSEELILEKSNNSKGGKSKVLYAVGNIAAMHSQKIGNALRTIDTWYPQAEENEEKPIAIEIYGAVTTLGKAYRRPTDKKDFYTLFDRWSQGEALEEENDLHYLMAVLVRGGVFGVSEKGDK